MLTLNNVEVIFENIILIIRGISLTVPEGGIIALLGPNGAGKSTTLKAISGLLHSERGEVAKGYIEFNGKKIQKKTPAEIVQEGIALVPEGRRVFVHLTTEENLMVGAHTKKNMNEIRNDIALVYNYFPSLDKRKKVSAGYLSGGEQQMLAIGRALMSRPKLMLLDEPSLGLAPQLVKEIFSIINRMNKEEHVSMLLVEQNAVMGLSIAQQGYIIENGRIVLSGDVDTLKNTEDVREFYLGITDRGHKSYRDINH